MLRTGLVRAACSARAISTTLPQTVTRLSIIQSRFASTAISNPTLSNIEIRWENMPPQEQADLWMALRDRMKVNWHEMTPQEKKAAYYIAFGPHGPRAAAPAGEGTKVFTGVVATCLAALLAFGVIRHFAGSAPATMSKEWQEATNAYFQEEKIEPITGPGQTGYTGKGQIQSAPSGKPLGGQPDEE